eukprot:CAMPEP_0182543420 /NCGR_PEP_ID=MMETSP1323-20130603/31638_1 /TAXON_ID=236787 /ORGANISM="Florenciella parvula, Strain RCC1693" /LENGTH=32 /DNA_ID= /DNA_START= /DNA_END= /DNA_ORIENTATION=
MTRNTDRAQCHWTTPPPVRTTSDQSGSAGEGE